MIVIAPELRIRIRRIRIISLDPDPYKKLAGSRIVLDPDPYLTNFFTSWIRNWIRIKMLRIRHTRLLTTNFCLFVCRADSETSDLEDWFKAQARRRTIFRCSKILGVSVPGIRVGVSGFGRICMPDPGPPFSDPSLM